VPLSIALLFGRGDAPEKHDPELPAFPTRMMRQVQGMISKERRVFGPIMLRCSVTSFIRHGLSAAGLRLAA
jgi:hypothetical protein